MGVGVVAMVSLVLSRSTVQCLDIHVSVDGCGAMRGVE